MTNLISWQLIVRRHQSGSETRYNPKQTLLSGHIWVLSLCELKHTLIAWYSSFASYITTHGFKNSYCEGFIFKQDNCVAYLLLFVLTTSNTTFLRNIIVTLSCESTMTDLRNLHQFLGIVVTQDKSSTSLVKLVTELTTSVTLPSS